LEADAADAEGFHDTVLGGNEAGRVFLMASKSDNAAAKADTDFLDRGGKVAVDDIDRICVRFSE
jgi:hypothetical protein